MYRSIAFFLLVCLSLSGWGQRIKIIELRDFDQYQEVLKIAQGTDQLLFVILNDQGTTLGKMIDQGIFKEEALNRVLRTTVPCLVKTDNDMGSRLLQAFEIDSLPAFMLFNTDETLLSLAQGHTGSQEMTQLIRQAQENDTLYPKLQQAYINKTLSNEQWRKLIAVYGLNRPFAETQELVLEYLAGLNKEQLLSTANLGIITNYGLSLETRYPRLLLENRERIQRQGLAFDANLFFQESYAYNVNLAILNEDSLLLEKICKVLIPLSPENDPASMAFETKKYFAMETDQFQLYTEAVDHFVAQADTFQDTAEFYYEEAFFIADNFTSSASQKAAQALALTAFDYSVDFRYKMLAGYMAYLLKDYQEARRLVNEAKKTTDMAVNLSKADNLLKLIDKASGKNKETGGLIQYKR